MKRKGKRGSATDVKRHNSPKCLHSGFICSELQLGVHQLQSFLDSPRPSQASSMERAVFSRNFIFLCSHQLDFKIVFYFWSWWKKSMAIPTWVARSHLKLVGKNFYPRENVLDAAVGTIMHKYKMLPCPERQLTVCPCLSPCPSSCLASLLLLYIARPFCSLSWGVFVCFLSFIQFLLTTFYWIYWILFRGILPNSFRQCQPPMPLPLYLSIPYCSWHMGHICWY